MREEGGKEGEKKGLSKGAGEREGEEGRMEGKKGGREEWIGKGWRNEGKESRRIRKNKKQHAAILTVTGSYAQL